MTVTSDTIAQWPNPPTTPIEALAHTLDMYQDSPDGDWALIATSGIYDDGPQRIRTGVTWGDLRAIVALLKNRCVCYPHPFDHETDCAQHKDAQ